MVMLSALRRWTRAEVLDLIERNPLSTPRYELVDGELLVTPSPGGRHQTAAAEMFWLLASYLATEPSVGRVLFSPSDVELEPETTVGPDLFVVPPAEARRYATAQTARVLVLAVEILSPGSVRGDRGRKRLLYQRHVPEYWIVNTEVRCVELWRPGFTEPVVVSSTLEWHPAGASRPFSLHLPAYFARVFGEAG